MALPVEDTTKVDVPVDGKVTETPDPTTDPATPPTEDVKLDEFTPEERRKLKDENARRRIQNKELTKELTNSKARIEQLAKDVEALGGTKSTEESDKVVESLKQQIEQMQSKQVELAAQNAFTSEAVKKGIADPVKAFKLISVTDNPDLVIDPDTKEVVGMSKVVDALVKESPWVLGAKANTPPPEPDVAGPGNPPSTKQHVSTTKHNEALKKAMESGGGVDAAMKYMKEIGLK